MKLLRSKFVEALGEEGRHLVDVNTIDGFQVRVCLICSSWRLFMLGPLSSVLPDKAVSHACGSASKMLCCMPNFNGVTGQDGFAFEKPYYEVVEAGMMGTMWLVVSRC